MQSNSAERITKNFGENPYYIGEPWSEEDIEVFVRENMIEYWA